MLYFNDQERKLFLVRQVLISLSILGDSEVDGAIFKISNGLGEPVEAAFKIEIEPVDQEIPEFSLASQPFYLNSQEVLPIMSHMISLSDPDSADEQLRFIVKV